MADLASTSAELHAITDAVDRARDRVAGLAEPYLGSEREDLITAMHEAERQLLVAVRALRRAIKAADRG